MTSARFTDSDHTFGEFVRPTGEVTAGALPPAAGDIRAEYDAWIAAGNTPDPYVPPDPPRRLVPKSLILSRLTDAQVEAALSLMTARQRERWRAPDKPAVYFDDPEVLAVLAAIGADVEAVLAPE